MEYEVSVTILDTSDEIRTITATFNTSEGVLVEPKSCLDENNNIVEDEDLPSDFWEVIGREFRKTYTDCEFGAV